MVYIQKFDSFRMLIFAFFYHSESCKNLDNSHYMKFDSISGSIINTF